MGDKLSREQNIAVSLLDQEAQFQKDHEHLSQDEIQTIALEGEDVRPNEFSYSNAELARLYLERKERMRGCDDVDEYREYCRKTFASPVVADVHRCFDRDGVSFSILPGREVKIVKNSNVEIKVGDWIVAFAPSLDDVMHRRYRARTDERDVSYESVRADQRLERQILQDKPVIHDNKSHASTRYKQPPQIKQRQRILHTRSNAQKRQLYGTLINKK